MRPDLRERSVFLNVPFDRQYRRKHSIFVFEQRRHRVQASLSDLNGFDPHVHGGTQEGILVCLLDCFGTTEGPPPLIELMALTRDLGRVGLRIQREQKRNEPFSPFIFRSIVGAATKLAAHRGLIKR